MQADVSRAAEVARLVEATERRLGPIDILINNAGISEPCGIEELSEALFDRTMAVNLKSAFLCTQAVLPGMRGRGFGRIVNISSGAARGAGAVGVHYNASKAGMEGLTRGYAARVVKDGVTVNAVAPSLIATEMIKPHRLDNLPAHPGRPPGHGRRDRERRADGGRQRLHDRPDRGRQRRPAFQLSSRREETRDKKGTFLARMHSYM